MQTGERSSYEFRTSAEMHLTLATWPLSTHLSRLKRAALNCRKATSYSASLRTLDVPLWSPTDWGRPTSINTFQYFELRQLPRDTYPRILLVQPGKEK